MLRIRDRAFRYRNRVWSAFAIRAKIADLVVIRVLHLITSFGLGGAEANLAQLVGRMDRSRFANSVVVLRRLPAVRRQVSTQKVPVHCLEMRPGIPNPFAVARLLRIVRSERPQVMQTWMYHADLLGLAVSRLAGVPKTIWNIRRSFINMHEHNLLSGLVLRLLVKLSSLPDAVVTNSLSGQKTHEALGYDPRRWVWIPNCIDCDRFKPNQDERTRLRSELGLPPDTPLVALIARYMPIKGHGVFIAAAGKLAAANPSVHFVLVGRGIDDTNTSLMRAINLNRLGERFHLLGERQDVERVFSALDILCSSSYGEGFPNVVGEAMACGVPCVVTDAGDSALLVGSFGKVVPVGDSAALCRSCEELLSSRAERERLGCGARHHIERRFSVASMVARYEELYEELAA
jgi:glycosyltransferase involved in cell wall biosynthesis